VVANSSVLRNQKAPGLPAGLMGVLSIAWLDRSIAAVACVPLVYLAYYRYEHWHHGFPLVAAALNVLICVATMIVRRPPKRVTPNPWYWLLAFVATYWQLLVLGLLQQGQAIAPNWISNAIAAAGLFVVLWARVSLGRNIGFVPAQRELVGNGAYSFVRHPVYTGGLLTNIAFLLRAFSPLNALLLTLGILWFIPVKSLVEEEFLRADPQYAAYMRRVRARWIPFLF